MHAVELQCRSRGPAGGQQGAALLVSSAVVTGWPRPPAAAPVVVTVGAPAETAPTISAGIYGANLAQGPQLGVGYSMNRWGGNAVGSRYNWEIDATNRAADVKKNPAESLYAISCFAQCCVEFQSR